MAIPRRSPNQGIRAKTSAGDTELRAAMTDHTRPVAGVRLCSEEASYEVATKTSPTLPCRRKRLVCF